MGFLARLRLWCVQKVWDCRLELADLISKGTAGFWGDFAELSDPRACSPASGSYAQSSVLWVGSKGLDAPCFQVSEFLSGKRFQVRSLGL